MLRPVFAACGTNHVLYMSTTSFRINRERRCLARVRYKTVPNVFDKKSLFARSVKKPVQLWLCYRVLTNATGMFRCSLAEVKAGMTGLKVFGPLPPMCLSTLREILCSSITTKKKKKGSMSRERFTLSEVLHEAKQLRMIPEITTQSSPVHLAAPLLLLLHAFLNLRNEKLAILFSCF